jgi:hypothetical protein
MTMTMVTMAMAMNCVDLLVVLVVSVIVGDDWIVRDHVI